VLVEKDTGEPHAGRVQRGDPNPTGSNPMHCQDKHEEQRISAVERRDRGESVWAQVEQSCQG